MTRPVVFSHSSVNAYLDCHLRWWFEYVAVMPGEQSLELRVGIGIHDVAEQWLRGQPLPEMEPEVERLAPTFMLDIAPTIGVPVAVERPFQVVVDGIRYSGVLDYVDEKLVLRDLKSTKQRPKYGRYRFQRVGYVLGCHYDLDIDVTGVGLDYIVRTQRPYYWPESYELPTEEDIDWFSATLAGVAAGVAREDYEPTGLGRKTCVSCPYAAVCGPYERYKEKIGGTES